MTQLFRLVGPLRPAPASAAEAALRATPDRRPTASASGQRDDAASLRAALDRLERLLKSDTPLRPDAPKGFYLNVLV